MRHIVFRVDASPAMGTGHLMRCLALADVLSEEGVACTFLSRREGLGALSDRIIASGHSLLALEGPHLPENLAPKLTLAPKTPHDHWLSGGMVFDLEVSISALRERPRPDWLIIDHYAIDAFWESSMRKYAKNIMVIDDLCDRDHDCDLLLDQGRFPHNQADYEARVPVACRLLLGPRYALLRREFSALQGIARAERFLPPPKLCIFLGGADAQDLTGRIVRLLIDRAWSGALDVVVGALYAPIDALKRMLAALPSATLYQNLSTMSMLMRDAGLAIGSPGVSSWERCACALPTLAIAQADNQISIGESLHRFGAHYYLGEAHESGLETRLMACLERMSIDTGGLIAMSQRASQLCDGQGAWRVAELLRMQ